MKRNVSSDLLSRMKKRLSPNEDGDLLRLEKRDDKRVAVKRLLAPTARYAPTRPRKGMLPKRTKRPHPLQLEHSC